MAPAKTGTGGLEREELLQALADNVQAMLGYYTVPDLRCAFANEAYAAATGFTTTSIIGRHGSEVTGAESWRAITPHLEVFLQGRRVTYDRVLTLPSGEKRYVEASMIPHVVEGRGFVGGFVLIHDITARRNAEHEQALILDHSVVGIAFIQDHAFQRCNRRLEQMYGYDPGELRGQPTRVCFLTEQAARQMGQVAYEALGRGETFASEMIHQRRDGEPFWVRVTGKAIDPARPIEGSIWNFEDITERKLAEQSLRENETLQRAILESASLMILSTDRGGRIASCNPATERLLDRAAVDLVGRPVTEVLFDAGELARFRERLREQTGLEEGDGWASLCARPLLGETEVGQWSFAKADGTRIPVELSVSALRAAASGITGFLLVAGDITERLRAEEALRRSHDELEARVVERTSELESEVLQRRRAEERLRHVALHDSLTGLPNRALLRQRLGATIDRAALAGKTGAVLFIDLDRFKNINDSLGHPVGDNVLRQAGRRIAAAVRAGDIVARLGGDEFVVVAPAVEDPERALHLARKIQHALQSAIKVQQRELFATPSIGISLFPRDGRSTNALLRNADTAMYQAKAAGRNAIRFFDPSMTVAAELYLTTESNLRKAVAHGELEPYYQPLVRLDDGRLEAVEMLARWHHPRRGLISPEHFIPVAEEAGLVGAIGQSLLEAACVQLGHWDRNGLAVPKLAVNLSATQFRDPGLAASLLDAVTRNGIEASRIELEITETALAQEGEQTLQTLRALVRAGFSIAVDDFGTGYSSLAYLRRFPVAKLKIDRSFVQDMTEDANDEAIVRTIISLARTLRLATVAEGVETAAQCEALRRMGCDLAQGYLFAKPMTATQFAGACLGSARATGE